MITLPSTFPVTSHTQYVGPGSTFVAVQGLKENGTFYIPEAIKRGATKVVIDQNCELLPDVHACIRQFGVTLERVENTRLALAQLSAQAAGNPAQILHIYGITGTKGKTTTTFLLSHMLRTAGYKTAMLSSVKNCIDDSVFPAPLTTAQPDYLHQFLKLCVDNGITHVVMEVAAQAFSLHRVHDIFFDGIIFTNFSQEHLEFYSTMQDYFIAKCDIFEQKKPDAIAILNGDDEWLSMHCKDYTQATWFGTQKAVQNKIVIQSTKAENITWTLHNNVEFYELSCPQLIGNFNIYNATAAFLMAHTLGISPTILIKSLSTFSAVPGRLEKYILSNGALCIIDYANGPMAYQVVLSLLRACTDHLIVVFGAGGDRDATKRPVMGAYAAEYADEVFVTSDNPRTEDPQMIMSAIIDGIPLERRAKVTKEEDRAVAIQKAFAISKPGSIIALLGKGPDEYQIIGIVKYPFSEKSIVMCL
jgi:UDP-N-acetylmuramyl-tripeptide synthetase